MSPNPEMKPGSDPTSANSESLARVLGPFDATCIVIGAIIGVGIFFSPRNVARIAGTPNLSLLAWVVAGLLALCGALAFAALGTTFQSAGSQYEILRRAYGKFPSFLYVFCNATYIQAGAIAIIACIAVQYLGVAVVDRAPTGLHLLSLATVLTAVLIVANVIGVRWGASIQNLTVIAKLATLVVIGILAATTPANPAAASPTPATSTAGVWIALFSAITPCFFAYGGWQHALWMAGEVRNPRRNIPLAILVGVCLVIVVYVSAAWAYQALLGYEGVVNAQALAAEAVARAWPNFGKRIIAAAVGLSAFGVLNAQLLSGPRLVYRMAQEGQFFRPFAKILAATGTPVAAIALLGLCGLGLLWLAGANSQNAINTIEWLTTGVVVVDGVFFALTAGAVLVLSRKPDGAGLRVTAYGYPFAPLVFILGELALVSASIANPQTAKAASFGLAWIAAAALIWLTFFARSRIDSVTAEG